MVCILLPSTNKKIVLQGGVSHLGTRLELEYYNPNWSYLHLHTEKITQYIPYFLEHGRAIQFFRYLINSQIMHDQYRDTIPYDTRKEWKIVKWMDGFNG